MDEEIARLVAESRPQIDATKEGPDQRENRRLISTEAGFVPAYEAVHKVACLDSVPAAVMVSVKTPFDVSSVDAQRSARRRRVI